MTASRHTPPAAETIRKAAAAAFEALPAILLAAALLMPALAVFAERTAEPQPAPVTEVGREIADQGNRALLEIRSRESLRRNLTLPELP